MGQYYENPNTYSKNMEVFPKIRFYFFVVFQSREKGADLCSKSKMEGQPLMKPYSFLAGSRLSYIGWLPNCLWSRGHDRFHATFQAAARYGAEIRYCR